MDGPGILTTGSRERLPGRLEAACAEDKVLRYISSEAGRPLPSVRHHGFPTGGSRLGSALSGNPVCPADVVLGPNALPSLPGWIPCPHSPAIPGEKPRSVSLSRCRLRHS